LNPSVKDYGDNPLEVARALVGRSVSVRRSEQSINFPLLVTSAFFIIGIP